MVLRNKYFFRLFVCLFLKGSLYTSRDPFRFYSRLGCLCISSSSKSSTTFLACPDSYTISFDYFRFTFRTSLWCFHFFQNIFNPLSGSGTVACTVFPRNSGFSCFFPHSNQLIQRTTIILFNNSWLKNFYKNPNLSK